MTEPKAAILASGTVFHGRYRVVRCINAGSMGAVYEALDTSTNNPRALKVMLPAIVQDADLRGRFEREARVTGGLESDHIVRVLDAGIDAVTETPFLVMELLRGEELGSLVAKRGALRPPEVVRLLTQAALALEKTHARGIVHRDLKPENMFVTLRDDGSPCVKILDFGIAKVVVESNQAARATRPMGTPLYMAPEQIRGDAEIGPAADVHAIGHIAYTLLTGEPYWTQEANSMALFKLLSTIVAGMPEAPSERALRRRSATLPRGFDAWLAKATTERANERFSSALGAVTELASMFGIEVSRPTFDGPQPTTLTADELAVAATAPALDSAPSSTPASRNQAAAAPVSGRDAPAPMDVGAALLATLPARDSAGVAGMDVSVIASSAQKSPAELSRGRAWLPLAIVGVAAPAMIAAAVFAVRSSSSGSGADGAEAAPSSADVRPLRPVADAVTSAVGASIVASARPPEVAPAPSSAPSLSASTGAIALSAAALSASASPTAAKVKPTTTVKASGASAGPRPSSTAPTKHREEF